MVLSSTYWWFGFAPACVVTACQCSSRSFVAFSKSSPSLRLLLAAIEMGALLSLTVEKIAISSSIHSSGERCCRWIVIRPQRFGALPFGRVAEACIGLHPVPVCIKAVHKGAAVAGERNCAVHSMKDLGELLVLRI